MPRATCLTKRLFGDGMVGRPVGCSRKVGGSVVARTIPRTKGPNLHGFRESRRPDSNRDPFITRAIPEPRPVGLQGFSFGGMSPSSVRNAESGTRLGTQFRRVGRRSLQPLRRSGSNLDCSTPASRLPATARIQPAERDPLRWTKRARSRSPITLLLIVPGDSLVRVARDACLSHRSSTLVVRRGAAGAVGAGWARLLGVSGRA